MENNDSQRIQELFLQALDLPADERRSWLSQECAGDEKMIEEVMALVGHDKKENDPLEKGLEVQSDLAGSEFNAGQIKPGQQITYFGDYEIEKEIARGGMGVVYRAHQVSLNRTVALKMILAGHWANEEQIQRFKSEASAAAKMDHPGIVPIYEIGEFQDQHYFSMRFIDGPSLADEVRDAPLSPKAAAEILKKVALAIAYAHERGVIHRDLKPANVLLDSNGEPKVTDFGLAKQMQSASDITHSGAILGTPGFMPPEQAAGKIDEVDVRSDVYSLGALLYFLLTTRPPFQASTLHDTLRQVFDSSPLPIRRLNPSAPKDLETICLKALSKNRSNRYDSAMSFAEDLDRWLSNQPIHARRVGPLERAWIWSKRRPMVAGLITTLVVLIVAGSFLFWDRQNASHAEGLVLALLRADTNEVNGLIEEIKPYEYWAESDLVEAWKSSPDGSKAKIHSSMILAFQDVSALEYLNDQIVSLEPDLFSVVCNVLKELPDRSGLNSLRSVASSGSSADARFRAACALAQLAPDDETWNQKEFCEFVVKHLIQHSPSEFIQWMKLLRPVGSKLIPPLSAVYVDSSYDQLLRSYAADSLGDYLSDDPRGLFELLIDSGQNTQLFATIFERIEKNKADALQLGRALASSETEGDSEETSLQKANAAAMLVRLGDSNVVWPLLKFRPDPRLRSYVIENLGKDDALIGDFISKLKNEQDPDIRQALLLCIGQFDPTEMVQKEFGPLIVETFKTDADSGVHSAAEWVLRNWKMEKDLELADRGLRKLTAELKANSLERQWYINRQGQTFAMLDALDFSMGSPDTEADRRSEEAIHRRRIDRRYAIATKEVTADQWRTFFEDTGDWNPDNPELNMPSGDTPMLAMTWYEAARYCNWLSQQEGIPEDQHCYVANSQKQFGPGMRCRPNFWELGGYRLPTEGEWEFACRGGAVTSRCYGETELLLSKYAWYRGNTNEVAKPVGRLKPNRFGLFDMHGNVYEWCFGEYHTIDRDISPTRILGDWPTTNPINPRQRRVMRGGAFNFAPGSVRSADRYSHFPSDRTYNMGFRPVRTIPDSN